MLQDSSHTLAPTALIIGCGYLGRRVAARLIERDVMVHGSTRQIAKSTELSALGVRPLFLDITQKLTLTVLRPVLARGPVDVFFLVPPGRGGRHDPSPREVIVDGLRNLIGALSSATIQRAVLSSSTAVYGQTDGVTIDADTPAQPADDRAKTIVESERIWLENWPQARVVRLAGLYGPGRIVGLDSLRQNAPIVGNPTALLNLIHVQDAADLLVTVAGSSQAACIELGSDGHPIPRLDYYRHLAQTIGVAEPTVLSDVEAAAQLGLNLERLRRSSSKACSITPTQTRTGWSPKFSDYRAGLADALAATR